MPDFPNKNFAWVAAVLAKPRRTMVSTPKARGLISVISQVVVFLVTYLLFLPSVVGECNMSAYTNCEIQYGHCDSAAPAKGFRCHCLGTRVTCVEQAGCLTAQQRQKMAETCLDLQCTKQQLDCNSIGNPVSGSSSTRGDSDRQTGIVAFAVVLSVGSFIGVASGFAVIFWLRHKNSRLRENQPRPAKQLDPDCDRGEAAPLTAVVS